MSPLPKITEIAGHITDATDITQVEHTIVETLFYGFFAPLGLICTIFITTSWIAILSVSIYEIIHDRRRGSWEVSESRPTSKHTNTYLNSVERARNSLLDVKEWSEYTMEGEYFLSRDELPNYGTMTQISGDEIDAGRRNIAVSKETIEVSLGEDQV